jgi:hypothetical protein
MRKFVVSFADSLQLSKREDASLLLLAKSKTAGMNFDVTVIRFATRCALEAFNKKAGLRAVVKTQVAKNCAVYAHESDSEAREASV